LVDVHCNQEGDDNQAEKHKPERNLSQEAFIPRNTVVIPLDLGWLVRSLGVQELVLEHELLE